MVVPTGINQCMQVPSSGEKSLVYVSYFFPARNDPMVTDRYPTGARVWTFGGRG